MKFARSLILALPLLLIHDARAVHQARASTAAPSLKVRSGGTPPSTTHSAPRAETPPSSTGERSLNLFQRRNLSGLLAGRAEALDTLRVLAIQVQFTDSLMGGQPGSRRREPRDSTYFANELTHLRQYFDGASRGRTTIAWEVTSKLYNLPQPMGYYGADDKEDVRVVEMMQSVIDSTDADVDFSRFDTFMIIHSGAGQETDVLDNSRVQIFSTFFDRDDIDAAFPDSSVDGLATGDSKGGEPFLVDNFMVLPSAPSQDGLGIGSLGIWAFITGSRLGLLPLFDSTPGGFPDSRGVGDFDLMSNGLFTALGFVPAFPSAFNRLLAGWVEPLVVESGGAFRLRDINSPAGNDTSCLRIPITESEYFLIVNRVHDTNFDTFFTFGDVDSNCFVDNADSLGGTEFDYFLTDFSNPIVALNPRCEGFALAGRITGSGLYVWHVDENVIRQNFEAGFLPNDFASRKGVDLEEADGLQDMDDPSLDLSFGSHFDSFREGNNDRFGPDTEPSSHANSGAGTGLAIRDISTADSYMTCAIEFTRPYDDTRTRWSASGRLQSATVLDLDGLAGEEIVVLADTGRVYAFRADGKEHIDRDADPRTIEPYFGAPGAVWRGPPAFGDLDGGGDLEIVAASVDGRLYAWKRDSTEVADGDLDPSTRGVLYQGAPLAGPPMLVDVAGDARLETAIVERVGDSLRISFLDASGQVVPPADAGVQSLWPARLQAQLCSPLSFAAAGAGGSASSGVLIAWADTLRVAYGVSFVPVEGAGAELRWETTFAPRGALATAFPATSSAAAGDLDRDGFDEVVLALPDGRLVGIDPSPVGSSGAVERIVVDLRSPHPSAPALGDIDGNGTLEIALWDDTHFYVFENNLRPRTNWPRPARSGTLGSYPRLSFEPPLSSPLVADVDGDGRMDVVCATPDGTLRAFRDDGGALPGFPRTIPAGSQTSPTLADLDGGGELSIVSVGSVALIATVDAVSDTIDNDQAMVLSIQSLPGSDTQGKRFWSMYHHDAARTGRVTESNPLGSSGRVVSGNSFVVYPNPVRGPELRARVVLNRRATVRVEIYNLEGERAVSRRFDANPADLVGTPFDEVIAVESLESGVYVLRLSVESSGGSEAFVKTFAILR